MLKHTTLSRLVLACTIAAALAACGGGGGSSGNPSGSLRLALTDAPACGFDAVHVTVQKVRIHQSSSANENEAGWTDIALTPPKRINLLTLTNGVLEELGQTSLAAGKYEQIRLVLATNDTANPLANAVTPTGQTETALTTPSGQTSGWKLKANIDVAAGKLADVVLDFDACKSVVSAGNSGKYQLKPVVSVIPRYASGMNGFVSTTLAAEGVTVSLQQGGRAIKSTVPDSTGRFVLAPVAPGSYTLVLAAPKRTTLVVTGVTVTADTVGSLNAIAAPLTSVSSPSGTVSGSTPLDSQVRLTQALTGGTVIEVASAQADATGHYSLQAATAAPLVAPYVAAPSALVFAADAAAAGKYSASASLVGYPDKTTVLAPLTAGGSLTANFTFP